MTSPYKPPGHHAVSPYLLVNSVAGLTAFLEAGFGASVVLTVPGEDGGIRHASIQIDDSIVMLGERPATAAASQGSTHIYVPDVDASYERALGAGATAVAPPRDQPYGDRSAGVRDPEGNLWWIGTHRAAQTG